MRQRMKPAARTGRALGIAAAATLVGASLTAVLAQGAMADTVTGNQAWRIVQQYQGVWTSPPTHLATGETVDAPLLGKPIRQERLEALLRSYGYEG